MCRSQLLFDSTFSRSPVTRTVGPSDRVGGAAMASLSYYQGGEWMNFPYSSEPRKPRIKVGLVGCRAWGVCPSASAIDFFHRSRIQHSWLGKSPRNHKSARKWLSIKPPGLFSGRWSRQQKGPASTSSIYSDGLHIINRAEFLLSHCSDAVDRPS